MLIPDREKAIEHAIKTSLQRDLIVIAGKGHENVQIFATKKIAFSDKLIARKYLQKYYGSL